MSKPAGVKTLVSDESTVIFTQGLLRGSVCSRFPVPSFPVFVFQAGEHGMDVQVVALLRKWRRLWRQPESTLKMPMARLHWHGFELPGHFLVCGVRTWGNLRKPFNTILYASSGSHVLL